MFIRTAFFRASLLLALALSTAAVTRAQNIGYEVANMHQELDSMRERVGKLELAIDALQRENADLREKASSGKQSYATVTQLNESVATLNKSIRDSRTDTLAKVDGQMKQLVRETNAALDQMAKTINTRNRGVSADGGGSPKSGKAAPTFSDNYPKDGISYTVQPGDSPAGIAKKTGAKQQDIINANRIADPTKLMVGQVLFIPGGKEPSPPAPAPNSPIAPAN